MMVFQVNIMDMDIYKYMDIYGYIYGYVWIYMDIYGYIWGVLNMVDPQVTIGFTWFHS